MWLARGNIKFKSRYLKAWCILKLILVIMVRFLGCHYYYFHGITTSVDLVIESNLS